MIVFGSSGRRTRDRPSACTDCTPSSMSADCWSRGRMDGQLLPAVTHRKSELMNSHHIVSSCRYA